MTTCVKCDYNLPFGNWYLKCTMDQKMNISAECSNIQVLVIIFCKVVCLVLKIKANR